MRVPLAHGQACDEAALESARRRKAAEARRAEEAFRRSERDRKGKRKAHEVDEVTLDEENEGEADEVGESQHDALEPAGHEPGQTAGRKNGHQAGRGKNERSPGDSRQTGNVGSSNYDPGAAQGTSDVSTQHAGPRSSPTAAVAAAAAAGGGDGAEVCHHVHVLSQHCELNVWAIHRVMLLTWDAS